MIAAQHISSAPSPRLRVLIADDERDEVATLTALMMDEGHQVREVYRGDAVLDQVRDFSPHVVLLDIGMPGMDGYEVARRMRASPYSPNASLVALTGWGQDEDRKRVREAGFDHHLVKPADLGTLQSLITSIQAERH